MTIPTFRRSCEISGALRNGPACDDPPLADLTGLWAYAHVSDVRRSIEFYAQFGLDVRNTHEEDGTLVWAFVTSSPNPDEAWARLMLARADGPIDPRV